MKTFIQSFKLLLLMTIFTGLIYPLGITFVGKCFFSELSEGSLIIKGGQPIGSALIAQKFEKPTYFWPRPSSIDFNPLPSGASNLGPTSNDLKNQIEARRKALLTANSFGPEVSIPQDLLTTSGSGLDPEISPEAAAFQIGRVQKARNLGPDGEIILRSLIASLTKKRDFGFLGEPTVNVLNLNLALDDATKKRQ